MSGNFTVLSPSEEEELKRLRAFYKTMVELACGAELSKIVPVYVALSEVDPNWNKNGGIWNDIEGRN